MADGLRDLDHLFIIEGAAGREFSRGGQGNAKVRPVEHRAHGLTMRGELDQTFSDNERERHAASVSLSELEALGTMIVLEGADAAYPLKVESLDRTTTNRSKWLLLAVHSATETTPEQAIVWVADAYRAEFIKLFDDYLSKLSTKAAPERWATPDGNPSNQALIANIARIRLAVLTDLWTSDGEPPAYGHHWWELWLDTTQPNVDAFTSFVTTHNLRTVPRSITFRDRTVVWVEATWEQLQILPFTRVPLAEIRRPEFVDTVEDLSVDEQAEYVQDLALRVTPARRSAPAVCHLDSGVFHTHVLLRGSLDPSDVHTVIGTSGDDALGHGTSMAGLALYGDLDAALASTDAVRLEHRLESVRMQPHRGEAPLDPLDFGTATAAAVALPEITTTRPRVFCLPLSATDRKSVV